MLPWFIFVLPVALLFARRINLLQLGDESASGLGIKVDRTRIVILVVCAALVAVSVAQCGPIGYVSLLAPHLTRAALRSLDARLVMPLSALCGATMLTAADQIARLLLAPLEIPVGIWTTLVGGSIFLLFVLKRRGGGIHG
ncbi:Hemin transport system permease protein HmuU [compost metagenome]